MLIADEWRPGCRQTAAGRGGGFGRLAGRVACSLHTEQTLIGSDRRSPTFADDGSIDVAEPIDGVVVTRSADLVATVLNAGCRPSIPEAWIATTARAHDVATYTPGSDFEEFPARRQGP